MHKTIALVGLVWAVSVGGCSATDQTTKAADEALETDILVKTGLIKTATPVLIADDVTACIEFWKAFGFETVATVPEGDGLGFAMLTNGAVTIMYQTRTSAAAQNPKAAEGLDRAALYLDVSDYDAVLSIAKTHPIVVDDHATDYGTREIYVRDPGGNLIGFAGGGE